MKNLNTVSGIGTDGDFLNGDLVAEQTLASIIAHQDPLQFFQKLMSIAGLTANGNFDNEVNGYQLIEALKFYIENVDFTLVNRVTEKGTKTSFLNVTPIALTSSKQITFTKGAGDIIEITGNATYNILEKFIGQPYFAHGEHLYIFIGGSQNITIINSIASNGDIETITGEDMLITPKTLIHFINNPIMGGTSFYWKMIGISKLPVATETSYGLVKTPLLTKVIEIGDWNMDTSTSPVTHPVPHGIDYSKIRSVEVMIRTDDDAALPSIEPLTVYDNTGGVGINGGRFTVRSDGVRLYRASSGNGGTFDNVDYDKTSYNRGWITIQYES